MMWQCLMTVSVLERVSSIFLAFKEQMLGGTPSHPPISLDKDLVHFVSLFLVRICMLRNFCDQISCSIVHPKYELKNGCVQAQAGKSPTLHFCVTSEPPLTENTTHVITGKMGGIIRRFKVQENCITFRKVKITDTGLYTISCRNAKGLVGTATLKLHILESASEYKSISVSFRVRL